MNEIAPTRPQYVPTPVIENLSTTLRRAVEEYGIGSRRYAAPDGDVVAIAAAPPVLTEAQRDEARAAAALYQVTMDPVTAGQVRDWLKPINAGVRNPQGPEDFAVRAAAIAMVCDGMPARLFGVETQRAMLAASQFFPSAADVAAVMQPRADKMRRELEALQSLARERPPAPAPEGYKRVPPTPEQMAANRATIAAMQAAVAPSKASAGVARFLSPAQLLAAHEASAAAGNRASETRAKMLREQFGADA